MNSQKRQTATPWDEFSRWLQKESVFGEKKKKKGAFELQNDRPPPSSLELHNNGLCYVHLSSVTTRLNDIIKMGMQKTHNMKVI